MVSKIVSNCQEEPIRYVNLEIPTEKQIQVEGDVIAEEVIAHTVCTSATCSIFCSLPLNKEVRDILENLDTALTKQIPQPILQQLQQPTSSLLNTKKLRKFLCLYCERTFATGSLRSKHEERCHSAKQARRSSSRFQQSPLKPTVCFLCPQNHDPPSLCPNDLFKHLLDTHSDTYFGCFECKERFSSPTHLQTHREEMHSTEDLNSGSSASNDLSPSSPPNGPTEDVKLNIEKEADIEDDEPDEPNKVQLRKRPPRRRKIAFRSAKLGVKRNTRLQAKQNLQTLKKRNVKPLQMDSSVTTTPEKSTSGSSVNSVSMSENPYPAFDAYYRVKKITDHSIDNLRISSLTFDDVFDKAFYSRIKCNIRENLMHHIDGKLFKNKESDARISNFEKGNNRLQSTIQPQQQQNPHQVSASATTENYGCELSLNAATPSSTLCTTHQLQAGEDILESQIEYGSKASNGKKKSQSSGQEEVRFKYLTRRKYQASILESKENRDLSRLDMWTQIVVKNRQQRIADDSKSDKERSEYKNGDEYKAKKQNEELNRVLDKRGPFEDLKEEANKQAVLEGNHVQEAYIHVTSIMEDILAKVFDGAPTDEVDSKLTTISSIPTVQVPELPAYLHLQRGFPSQPTYIDKSDKISLICSSQEIEGYNDHDTLQSEPNKLVELTGEWARSRLYICAVCGLKVSNMKLLMEHKSIVHMNVWCQHYEFVGNQGELYRHLSIPALGKMGEIETQPTRAMWRRSEARHCSKCSKQCNSLGELHRHILECGEDWAWMMARKKCKYRPFGAKTRKKRRGLFKRIVPSSTPGEKRIYKKKYHEGPRQKPSDAETIQRMLANLPAKRATRKIMSLKDGFPSHRKSKALSTSASNKKEDKMSEVSANSEDAVPVRKAKCNPVLRSSMRNVNKVIASKILDTNSSLLLRRRLRRTIRNVPKSTIQNSEKTEEETAIEKTVPELEDTDGLKKQDKTSLLDRMKLLKKRVVRKVRAKKINDTTIDGCDMTDKRVTRNATIKVDTEGLSENHVSKKKALKTDTKLCERNLLSNVSSESLTDALLDNNSIDIVIEIEPAQPVETSAANLVNSEEATAIIPVADIEKSIKRSLKKRRSNIGAGKTVVKKICLQNKEVSSDATELSNSKPDSEKDVLSAATYNFLGTIDLIPRVRTESEDATMVAKLSSLEVLAEEVSRSDASAPVAISDLVVNPPLEIAIVVCPKELPINEVVDLSVQHITDNVAQSLIPKINSTPSSKRCKRNKGLNDCIAMLTSKLLHVNEEENQTANTSTNNVSLPSEDVINKVAITICEPINHKEHDRDCSNEDTDVCELKRYALIDALPHVNSEIIKPNILNIPPVLNSKLELSKSKLDDLHRINLPSTIVPIIKIPNYPLKLFGVNESDRNLFKSIEIRNVNLNIPRDLNIYPMDHMNKACDLVAQDLTMPAIRVPSCTFPDSTSFKPTERIINEMNQKVFDVQPEIIRESTESINTPEEKTNKSHAELLNMSTYEMKTITLSTETIISTAEPEILAGNPLPEEAIQKSQMLPIEAAKCDIEENKEINKNVLNDLMEISENILSLKKCRRPVKPKVSKSAVARSCSKRKENSLEDINFSKSLNENKIEETEISLVQTKTTTRKYQSKARNKDSNVEVLPLQNLIPSDMTVLPQNNISEDSDIGHKEVEASKPISIISQEEENIVKSTNFTIKSLINTPSDSDDELPLSKLIKSSTIATNNLIKKDSIEVCQTIVVNEKESRTSEDNRDMTIIIEDPKDKVVTIGSEKEVGKQSKKPCGRKPTKQQSKIRQVDELPLALIKDDLKICVNSTTDSIISSVIFDKLEEPTNVVISDAFSIKVGDNASMTVKKRINRKKGKRKQVDNILSASDIIDSILPQIKNSIVQPTEDDSTIAYRNDSLIQENSRAILSLNVSLTSTCTDVGALNEPLNELLTESSKGVANRGKTLRKNMEIEDEIPLSILLKSSTDVKDILKLDELSSKTKFTIVNVAEDVNVQGVEKGSTQIETTTVDVKPKVNMVEVCPKEALKQTVNRKKKGRRGKNTQTKKLISNIKMQINDNAVSPVNAERISINERNIESDASKDVFECGKLPNKIENLSEILNNTERNQITSDLEKDEVDGSTVFTDSSIRTCSIIEATIDSAFRINAELNEVITVVEINSHPIIASEAGEEDSGVSITLNGVVFADKKQSGNSNVVKIRKSSKKLDRKKKRKKVSKFRRMPKLKAMKAYIDSVSEDTTSKGLDTPDEHSISDINLECLLRTNSPSLIADDPPIVDPVLVVGLATDDNEPISPNSILISNDLPEVSRSDQSSPIEEFASDCNNSFDGLIRSHEPFDVTRELESLEEPLIPPLKLSNTGILDPVATFNKLASKDLDIEQMPKLLDQLETIVEPIAELKIEFPVVYPEKKSNKIKKKGKGQIAKKSNNTLAFNEVPQNLISDQVNEISIIVRENDKLLPQSQVHLLGFSKDKEESTDVTLKLPEIFDLPIITIESEASIVSTGRKFDSSIYDFDPTSEDLLLDEKSLCKSPSKQKIMHITNKEVLVDTTVAEVSFSPRRSRSRKSDSHVLQLYSSFDNTNLKSPLQIATEEVLTNDIIVNLSPNVLKEIHDENEINYSPRRSRSRKSETILVETEVPSNVIATVEDKVTAKVIDPSANTTNLETNNSVSIKTKSRLKPRQGKTKGKGRKKAVIPDPSIEEKESFCDICYKSFARNENLMKHKRTLTHIAKLSEIEAREAQIKADNEKMLEPVDPNVPEEKDYLESIHMDEEDLDVDTSKYLNNDHANCSSEVDIFPGAVPVPYSLPPKLADIISDVLSKPVDLNNFDNLQQPISQMKRYKSLGERKSFDSETVSYNNQFPTLLNEEPMPPSIQTADSILKTQISILENIIENKSSYYINEDSCKSTDSKQSNGRCPSDMSLVSDIKQDDSNIISFSQHSNMNIIEPRLTGSFLKPSSHYEEISEDSTVVRKHFEDQKARKVLNRDEELFLECCSLLKSSSEVSNFSKQSARKTIPNRPVDDHEWLKTNQFYESNSNFHESNPPSNTTDFYSDASRANSPIGDSFIGDMSNSDTLRNDWQSENSKFKKADSFEDISLGSMNDNTNDNILTKEDSMLNKDDVSNLSKDSFSDDFNLDSGSLKNEVTDPKIEEFAISMKNALTSSNKIKIPEKKATSETNQTSIIDYAVAIVKENTDTSDFNTLDRKVITKGARKVFEGLKVSIPTNELNMKEVLNCSPAITNINSVDSPVGKKKLSKIGNKLGLKVTKKKNKPKKKEGVELSPTINLSLHNSDKIHDVYDFEETQDNTELFNSNLSKFRSQGSEKTESNVNLENSDNDEPKSKPNTPNIDEMPSLSNFSESESTHSTKQKKKTTDNDPTANNNNKKKCMIMGRIFKNAFKSRIDLEISDIPCVDNNSLVENYVMNCTNTAEIESRFDKIDRDDKKKMSQEEMDALFDKLLHENDNVKFSKNGTTSDGNKIKPPPLRKSIPKTDKPKNGIKKRQRQNSNTSDDEFCITKARRKKPTKKKVQDNSINLEQELKECMGVAGRKSQRKCTSGKQNVLVEYWSSDDSNFEALINPDFVRRKRDMGEKNQPPAQEPTEATSTEYSTKGSPSQIDPAVLAEIHKDIINATKQKTKKNGVKRKQPKTDTNGEALKVNRRKRSTGDTLYYWSSSSDDESRDLIEVKPIREEIDEDDEDRPMQHGWIVGDSPKKLVTMLAQAKGKKIDVGVCVKEQPKKRTSL